MSCRSNAYQLAGPFNQTLFLGCSVTNIDMNMGWGAEVSSCRVNLIKDLYRHNNHPAIQSYKATIYTRSSSTNLNRENPNVNETRDLPFHQTILQKEKDKWQQLNNENNNLPSPLQDTGKHYWKTYRSNIPNQYNIANPSLGFWTTRDPGFLGDYSNNEAGIDIDLIGCPVFFRFMDIWFGGMIKKWGFNSGKYDVEINSFASLLGGCQLILQKYYGSISTMIGNTSSALGLTGQNLAVPYNDLYYPCGNNPGCTATWPQYNGLYNGSVYQGNIPNIFNVFGYLENNINGSSGFVEGRGVSARSVYFALKDMLEPKINRVQFGENVFNPYGAIVARTPFDRGTQTFINPHNTTFNMDGASALLSEMGLLYAPTAVDGLSRSLLALDISEVPAPPQGVYISEDTMSIISFIEYCCTNAGKDFIIDFIPMELPDRFNPRTEYYTGTIKIRTVTRDVQAKPNTIRSFILDSTFQQNVVSYNFGEEYQDVKTRSVLIGGPQERLHQFTTNTGGPMGWYRIYEPLIDSFVPITSFANNSTQQNSLYNTYKMPDHANQRVIPNGAEPWRQLGGAATAQENNSFYTLETNAYGNNIVQGSYLPLKKPALNSTFIGPSNSYPIYLDIISPYFGKSNNGEYRRVYLDRKTGNLQIIFDFRDIQPFFPTQYDITDGNWSAAGQVVRNLFPGIVVQPGGLAGDVTGGAVTSGKFVVEEDEIRAAMSNPGDWYYHLNVMLNVGKPTATSKILFNYISRTVSDLFAKSYFQNSLDLKNKGNYLQYVQTVENFYSAFRERYIGLNGIVHDMGLNMFASAFALTHPELNDRQFQQSMDSINNLFENVRLFIRSVGEAHYGKHFAVRLPQLSRYTNNSNGDTIYNYSIVADAWEEPGNMIDDTMDISSLAAQSLTSDNRKMPPLLGFDNGAEYDFPPIMLGTHRHLTDNNLMHSSSLTPFALYNRTIIGMSLKNPLQTIGIGPALANRYYHPLIHNLPQDSYIMLPYTVLYSDIVIPGGRLTFSPIVPGTTAHNMPRNANSHLYKIYAKAQILSVEEGTDNPQITFCRGTPRAVLALPSPMLVRSGPYDNGITTGIAALVLGDEEPDEVDIIAAPDLNQFFRADSVLLNQGPSLFHDGEYIGITDTQLSSNTFPRAAKPIFAAIPLRNNLVTYGPWVSHPGLIANTIFPGQGSTQFGLVALVNNLVGGVDVKIDPSLVPWEYGGMNALDAAALSLVGINNGYQQVLETGDITLAGIMLKNWTLGSYLNDVLGPIVSSIKITIGDNGITTQYSLRTFSRKIGFYNKEQADNIKNINQAMLLQNRRFSESIKNMQTRLIQFASKPMGTRPY
jgi:hypothetical protein